MTVYIIDPEDLPEETDNNLRTKRPGKGGHSVKRRERTVNALKALLIVVSFFLVACGPGSTPPGPGNTTMPQVAIPTFRTSSRADLGPDSGEIAGTETLIISTASAGASIYYSMDGSDPTTSSSRYIRPVELNGLAEGVPHTIKAMAAQYGMNNSAIAEVGFTVAERGRLHKKCEFFSP